MSKLAAAVAILLVLLLGCDDERPKFNFPSDINNECHNAMNEAKACIISKGTPLKTYKGCTLKKRAGEKKFGSMWCWYEDKYWHMYVGGLCYGTLIEVGSHPQTGKEIMFDVVRHEFGHYWLMTNGGNGTHNPTYSSCFFNWKEPRASFRANPETIDEVRMAVKNVYDSADEGDWISVDGVDKEGRQYHFDFIVIRGDM